MQLLLSGATIVSYMQTAESIPTVKDDGGIIEYNENEYDNSDKEVDEDEEMRRASGWFGFGFGKAKEDAAKEEAARLTREADIRRLYEAGTQREVLEQLYNPEEVLKCIQQID